MAARVVGRRLLVHSERACPLWVSENGSLLNTALPVREYLHTLLKSMTMRTSLTSFTACAHLCVKDGSGQKHQTREQQRLYSVERDSKHVRTTLK